MHITTKRWAIQTVAEHWKAQYYNRGRWENITLGNAEVIYNRLVALRSEPIEADVTKVIGNDSWTTLRCEECGQSVQTLVTFREEYDSVQVCPNCIRKALVLCGDLRAADSLLFPKKG